MIFSLFLSRFFGNRSYCFDRLEEFAKALQDAEVTISLAPVWPKGYFRKGRALAGLKVGLRIKNNLFHFSIHTFINNYKRHIYICPAVYTNKESDETQLLNT